MSLPQSPSGLRIVVWGINYAPEATGIGPFNRGLCRYLAARGHDVAMVTSFAYYPQWRKSEADRRQLLRTERDGAVTVYRSWHYVPSRPGTVRRMLHELSFALGSLPRLLLLPRADLYLVVGPPLVLGPLAWLASRLQGSRFVFHVQDLQPDAGVALGMVRPDGLLTRVLRVAARLTYRTAALVSGISPTMLKTFTAYGVPAKRQYHFPNWVDLERYPWPIGAAPSTLAAQSEEEARGDQTRLRQHGRGWRQRHGIPTDAFVASYAGNLGRKQGLELLLDAAERSDAGRVHLVIAGDGAVRASLAERLAARPIPNVTLLPLQSDADYAALLAASDVCLIAQARGSGAFCLPSKLLTVLMAGRPVAAVADEDSELARAVAEGEFGIVTPPDDPQALANGLASLAARADRLPGYSRRGLHWVAQFEADAVLGRFEARLRAVVTEPEETVPVAFNPIPRRQ